ncbi:hypothetical protein EGW08_010344 [Elysia chlorotica]|uniref:Uncharacterized protein n=1 Tax=Elysia chlorotica TaxID=188477 RepID=A0A3S1BEM2_ELYCH|nr:hypothetical protein EGW08_010344 [Elysia chlorotica]
MRLKDRHSGQEKSLKADFPGKEDSGIHGLADNGPDNNPQTDSSMDMDKIQDPPQISGEDSKPQSNTHVKDHYETLTGGNSKNNLFQDDGNDDDAVAAAADNDVAGDDANDDNDDGPTNPETFLLSKDKESETLKSENDVLKNSNGANGEKKSDRDNKNNVYDESRNGNTPNTNNGLRSRKNKKRSSKNSSMSDNSNTNSDEFSISNKKEDSIPNRRLIFGLVDTPPLHYLFFFAIQQACLAISSPLGTTAIVAQAVCAESDLDLKVRILSSTMIMMGVSTFLMTTVGIKLPIFQGPSPGYIIPLIIMMSLEEFACPETFWATDPKTNTSVLMAVISGNRTDFLSRDSLSNSYAHSQVVSSSASSNSSAYVMAAAASNALQGDAASSIIVPNRDVSIARIQAYSGSLMVAGAIHCALGLTGLLGVIARYVGPVTIVPVMLLFGIYIHTVIVMFSETNWTVAAITAGTCIVLGLFLADRKTPLPVWTPGKGFRIVWTYTHQIFALLIALVVGWLVSFVMTVSGALSGDPDSVQFKARTDARQTGVSQTDWILLPYPGQFGAPSFSGTALISFLISTFISILDSIGDYYATARAARAPPPPSYALNRGVATEGAMSILSGCMGCGHATVSYSENIGAIGLSRVASRSVFQVVGAFYVCLAVLGKVAAVFVSIPDAVIGGSQIVTFGILIGVILSYLQVVDLKTSRNVSIIGITITLGMMLPYWIKKAPAGTIDTGYPSLDNVITVCLSNPPFLGGVVAFILDNLVPGTLRERGIIVDEVKADARIQQELYVRADDVADDLKDNAGDDNDDDVGDGKDNKEARDEIDDDVRVLVDDPSPVLDDDRYDVGVDVYRINWIPNCMRTGLFARVFPIFDKRLNV